MNANQLLEYLQNGATLKARYKYGSFKLINTLTLPTGEHIKVQDSTLKPLLQDGKVISVLWSGGATDYYLKDTPRESMGRFR